jgi:hypothetical protein
VLTLERIKIDKSDNCDNNKQTNLNLHYVDNEWFDIWDLVSLGSFDHINQMITLNWIDFLWTCDLTVLVHLITLTEWAHVITLSDFRLIC